MVTVAMRNQLAWLAHALGGNPLCRRVDRLTAIAIGVLVVLVLVAIPGCAVFGKILHDQQSEAAARETADRYQTTALLTEAPQTSITGGNPESQVSVSNAPVQWTDHQGQPHSAVIQVPERTSKDSAITIWVDPAGNLAPPPTTQAQATLSAVVTALFVLVAVETSCFALAAGAHGLAGVYARRAWAREWDIVEPRWTRPAP